MKALLFGLAACAVCVCATGEGQAVASISDMAWIAGRWVDDSGGDLSEETWGPPSGDCVIGMWRWVVGGKARVYELLTITAEADGLVIRLRHFDRVGVAREDREHPLVLNLVRSSGGEAAFQGPGTSGFLRLSYRRVNADTLTVVLEKGTSEKDAQREEFRFRRAAP